MKTEPGKLGLESVLKESEKLEYINGLCLPSEILKQIPTKTLTAYKMRIASQSAWETKRHPANTRYALVSIFLHLRRAEIIDGLIELLIQIIHKLTVRAGNKVKKNLLKDFKKVYGKNQLLYRIANAALKRPQGLVEDVIFPIVNEHTLDNLIKEYKSNGPGYKHEVHKVIRASYSSHYRRMIPKILDALPFRSNNERHQPVLNAWQFIKRNQNSSHTFFQVDTDVPIEGVIPPKWMEVVVERSKKGNEKINRINYEICVLQALREKLRCKEIWVEGADKFRNPDDDLPQDFTEKRDFYYQDLGHHQDAKSVAKRKKRLKEAAKFSSLSYANVGHSIQPITINKTKVNNINNAVEGSGRASTYRFIVRGHWKQQAYGPKRSLRKKIRIAPYYRGDDVAQLINKPYLVK